MSQTIKPTVFSLSRWEPIEPEKHNKTYLYTSRKCTTNNLLCKRQ